MVVLRTQVPFSSFFSWLWSLAHMFEGYAKDDAHVWRDVQMAAAWENRRACGASKDLDSDSFSAGKPWPYWRQKIKQILLSFSIMSSLEVCSVIPSCFLSMFWSFDAPLSLSAAPQLRSIYAYRYVPKSTLIHISPNRKSKFFTALHRFFFIGASESNIFDRRPQVAVDNCCSGSR